MKLTNQELDMLRELIESKIKQTDTGPENDADKRLSVYFNLLKKIDTMYFS